MAVIIGFILPFMSKSAGITMQFDLKVFTNIHYNFTIYGGYCVNH